MPLDYCSCVCAGKRVELELDLHRPGFYICSGCGAPEEVVQRTADLMQEDYTKTGRGFGHVPESLLLKATLIDSTPEAGPRVTPFQEPWVESQHHSGRSLKELEQMAKEVNG